ncbi:hypothetical protein CROQUDRAFT_691605 [Cronartium quercuum f. sp. fusiforme G11]|uniref:RING-type domain-containing protein n=1 Tax=Cronartium quercuum f. sp. fusiforme G11 TaxID=708437 RepID=A0A9P6NMX9_9BASI|nr:hypothetical protein CROQUDRAFT_691605 [Cronartium quercuum f. sp. fusiforme G11]
MIDFLFFFNPARMRRHRNAVTQAQVHLEEEEEEKENQAEVAVKLLKESQFVQGSSRDLEFKQHCPVCLVDYEVGDRTRELKCHYSHILHPDCARVSTTKAGIGVEDGRDEVEVQQMNEDPETS